MNKLFLFLSFWWRPVLEIIIFTVIFYFSYLSLRSTRAFQVIKGIALLLIIFVVAKYLELTVIASMLSKVFGVAIVVLAVLFQPELRRVFASLGRPHFDHKAKKKIMLPDILTETFEILKEKYIGALIVIARGDSLQPYIDTGVLINSDISVDLLITIFTNKTPLHDGAVIIENDRLVAASCLLPLSQRSSFSRSFGTRHRAGIGLSEETDAMVLIASEETGRISICSKGQISHDIDINTFRNFLADLFPTKQESQENIFSKMFKKYFSVGKEHYDE